MIRSKSKRRYDRSTAERLQQLRADNPGYSTAKNLAWKADNREKYLAHKAVEYALKIGNLERLPCERCGTMLLVHAHHDDYEQRLTVIWLCPIHHRERHKQIACGAVTSEAS